MQLHHILVAALGSTAIGFGQCDLLNQNFNSVGLFTPISSVVSPVSGMTEWTSSQQGTAAEPTIASDSSGTFALRLGHPASISNALRSLNDLNLPPIFRLSFDFRTAVNGAVALTGSCTGVSLWFDAASNQIRFNSPGGPGVNLLPAGAYNSVDIYVDINGDCNVLVNGAMFVTAPWGCSLPTFLAVVATVPTANDLWIDNLCFTTQYAAGPPIGQSYCTAVPNSTGQIGNLEAFGSPIAANNGVSLVASSLPPYEFGLFLTSATPGFVPAAGGSMGNLCLGGAIGRYVQPGQVMNAGAAGVIALPIDLTQTPQGAGFVSVLAGQTRSWQVYHRDGVTSNYTRGLSIMFQ